MQLLFRTWNHIIPLAIVSNKTLRQGDVVKIKNQNYYINCKPNTISASGKRIRFFYCIRATNDWKITNTVKKK